MRRAVSTASRCVDGRGSWGDRLDARRGRRRRRGGGAEAARSGEREENARSVFACVDVGNVGEHAFHSRELERACAVVRTRCFYEIENERRGETLTFSFDDADQSSDAASHGILKNNAAVRFAFHSPEWDGISDLAQL